MGSRTGGPTQCHALWARAIDDRFNVTASTSAHKARLRPETIDHCHMPLVEIIDGRMEITSGHSRGFEDRG